MEENIKKINDSNLFLNFQQHPNPKHPLVERYSKERLLWVADVKDFRAAKKFLSENKIFYSLFNKKKSVFIWP